MGSRPERRFGNLGHVARWILELLRLDRRRRRRSIWILPAATSPTSPGREIRSDFVADTIHEQHAAIAKEVIAVEVPRLLDPRHHGVRQRGDEILVLPR